MVLFASSRKPGGAVSSHRLYVDPSYEVDVQNGTHSVHVFAGSRRLATLERSGLGLAPGAMTEQVRNFHPDHVGSNTLVTDHRGEPVQKMTSEPFGGQRTIAATASPGSSYLFTDQEYDPETGLDEFGARYYDSQVGRFLSPDPALIGPDVGATFSALTRSSQAGNAFAYVENRPTGFVDPTGEKMEYLGYVGGVHNYRVTSAPVASQTWQAAGTNYAGAFAGAVAVPFASDAMTAMSPSGSQVQPNPGGGAGTCPSGESCGGGGYSTEPNVPDPVDVAVGAGALWKIGMSGGLGAFFRNSFGRGANDLVGFGRNANQVYHTFRHVEAAGLQRGPVQAAIRDNLRKIDFAPGKLHTGTVDVGGQTLRYSAFKLPDGSINVGRITLD